MNLEMVNHEIDINEKEGLSEIIVTFDYMSMALPDLAQKISGHHQQAKHFAEYVETAARMSLDAALGAGQALLAAKAIVPHGKWTKWIQEHIPSLSSDQASRYMQLARQFPHVRNSDKLRTVREAYIACGIIKVPTKKTTPLAMGGDDKVPAMSPSDFVSRFQSMRGFLEIALPRLDVEKMQGGEREDLASQIKGIILILTVNLERVQQTSSSTISAIEKGKS